MGFCDVGLLSTWHAKREPTHLQELKSPCCSWRKEQRIRTKHLRFVSWLVFLRGLRRTGWMLPRHLVTGTRFLSSLPPGREDLILEFQGSWPEGWSPPSRPGWLDGHTKYWHRISCSNNQSFKRPPIESIEGINRFKTLTFLRNCSFQFNKLRYFNCLFSNVDYSAKSCSICKFKDSFELLVLRTTRIWY